MFVPNVTKGLTKDKYYVREYKTSETYDILPGSVMETGKWIGPLRLLRWGFSEGMTKAILEDPISGELMMVPPGMLKIERTEA